MVGGPAEGRSDVDVGAGAVPVERAHRHDPGARGAARHVVRLVDVEGRGGDAGYVRAVARGHVAGGDGRGVGVVVDEVVGAADVVDRQVADREVDAGVDDRDGRAGAGRAVPGGRE